MPQRRYQIRKDNDPLAIANWDVIEQGWDGDGHSGVIASFESCEEALGWLFSKKRFELYAHHEALWWRNVGESMYYEKRRQERDGRHQRPEADRAVRAGNRGHAAAD